MFLFILLFDGLVCAAAHPPAVCHRFSKGGANRARPLFPGLNPPDKSAENPGPLGAKPKETIGIPEVPW